VFAVRVLCDCAQIDGQNYVTRSAGMETGSPRILDFKRRMAFVIAVSGGAGLVSVWPGTAGAAVGVLLAAALLAVGSTIAAIAGCVVVFAAGVWASSSVCRESGLDDPQTIVVDETVGCAAVLCCLPMEPLWWVAGFVAFRLFDTLKPWPIRAVEVRIRGGVGVMLDDALAAAMAVAALLLPVHALRLLS
jgi:phosphatidylglycerophosphatase A